MSYQPVVISVPRTEHALADPERWNKEWEDLFRLRFLNPETCFQNAMQRQRTFVAGHGGHLDASYHSYTMLLETTCEVQHRIGVRGLDALVSDGFEEKWKAATVATRRKHVLIALSEACSMARNLNDSRMYCWDLLKLDYLSKSPGAIVKLLKAIIPDDVSFIPKTPYYFPEPSWDQFSEKQKRSNAPEIEKICLAELLILRTKLIYFVVEFTFYSFFGRELPKVTVIKSTRMQKNQETADDQRLHKELLQYAYGRNQAKQVLKEDRAAAMDRRSQRVVPCTHCQRVEKEGEKFQRCARCRNTLGREIPYCSKDCQVKDWKSRHKAICGKPFDMEAAIQSASPRTKMPVPVVTQIGPPTGGFKRSPALVLHVHKLNADPELDLSVKITETSYAPFELKNDPFRDIFRAARDKAMITGDKESAALLCHFVVWNMLATRTAGGNSDIDVNTVINHMKAEYEYEGLKKAVLELQEQQWKDRFRRPPLLMSVAEPFWLSYLNLMKTANPNVNMNARLE